MYLRQNPLSGEWIIIAPERSQRPNAFYVPPPAPDDPAACPFCPGREDQTPPEVLRWGGEEWDLRVVPNKYPAVSSGLETGAHEVVIETPEHAHQASIYTPRRLVVILEAWRERYLAHRRLAGVRYVAMFKNSATMSGASILHPHSQILALPFVPARPAAEAPAFLTPAGCPICRMATEDSLKVWETPAFSLFLSPAARTPFQLWILPRAHTPSFLTHESQDREELAAVLHTAVRVLDRRFPGCAFNWAFQEPPLEKHTYDPRVHWYAEVFPRLTVVGGFEWSTGCYINVAAPEQTADELRSLL